MNKFRVHLKWQILRTRLYMEYLSPKAFYLPAVIFLLTTAALIGYYNLNHALNLWSPFSLASGNAFHFCEQNHMDELIRQPSNTWSNLGFFVVGLVTLTLGIHDFRNADRKQSSNFLVRYPIFSIMFALSAFYVFLGSFLYHASLTEFFQKLDQAGLYSVIVMAITFNLYKIFPVVRVKEKYHSSHALMVAFAVGFNYLIFTKLMPNININVLFPFLIVVIFITSVYYLMFISKEHYFTNYLWAAFAVLILASIIWILDRTSVVCNPTSMFQGHALWHLFCSVSIMLIYMYYRSGKLPLEEAIAYKKERREMRIRRRRGEMVEV